MIKNKKLPDYDYNLLINKYCPELLNIDIFDNNINIINSQSLNIDFIKGLFDGDGYLTIRLKKNINTFSNTITFGIVQDIYNKSILEEIKNFFNTGYVRERNNENSINYLCEDHTEFINKIFPIICNNFNITSNLNNYSTPHLQDGIWKKYININ